MEAYSSRSQPAFLLFWSHLVAGDSPHTTPQSNQSELCTHPPVLSLQTQLWLWNQRISLMLLIRCSDTQPFSHTTCDLSLIELSNHVGRGASTCLTSSLFFSSRRTWCRVWCCFSPEKSIPSAAGILLHYWHLHGVDMHTAGGLVLFQLVV